MGGGGTVPVMFGETWINDPHVFPKEYNSHCENRGSSLPTLYPRLHNALCCPDRSYLIARCAKKHAYNEIENLHRDDI